ncbi:MAG TPA: ComF family protein [Bryobacteraceae bacterium]|nr:ComF family protein [Bryobacteraceae bacterium]
MPVCAACLKAPSAHSAEYFCAQCKTPFLNSFPLDLEGRCGLCRAGTRGFDSAYCFGSYDGALRELIHLLKYEGMKPLAGPLGEYLWRALPVDEKFDAVVAMPLHWRRRFQRGFNQASVLAGGIARRRKIPLLSAVRRVRATRSQTGLTNAGRRQNVSGAFRTARGRPLEGMRILLVDDVMTTGATGSACASALKRAGALSVTLLTLARVDRRAAGSDPRDSKPVSSAMRATVGAS